MDQGEAGALFDRVTDIYKGQVGVPDEWAWQYPVLSAVTLGSYQARHADTWPIVNVEGPTASGKWKIASALGYLGYRVGGVGSDDSDDRIAVFPTVQQLYLDAHVPDGEEPRLMIYDEFSLEMGQRDMAALLRAGVERGKYVPRRGVHYRPYGIKVLVHEDPLPRTFHSLRRRMIRLSTFHNRTFKPALTMLRDVRQVAADLKPELARWHDEVELSELIRRYLAGEGAVELSAEEGPVWCFLFAVGDYCGRLDALTPALEAHRAGQEVNMLYWWREHALPVLRDADPAGRTASELLGVLRQRLGPNVPPISADQLGRRISATIKDGRLPWEVALLDGKSRYQRRRGVLAQVAGVLRR